MSSVQRTNRPNILLFVMDATRSDRFSCYGNERNTTPHLDKLAAKGVLYEQSISPAIWTLASMASMFTGLHVSQHGTHFDHQYLDPRFKTIAEVLHEQGYQTMLGSPGGWLSEPFGFRRGFDTFQNYMNYAPFMRRFFKRTTRPEKVIKRLGQIYQGPTRGKRTYEVMNGVRDWFMKERQKDRPFFAVTHCVDPHWPWYHHPKFSWRNGGKAPRLFAPDGNKYVAGVLELTDEDRQMMVDYYDGEVAFLDDYIGRMLNKLEKAGHLENTLVIVTADHGEHLGEHHLMGHKMSVYEDLIRVPLILYHPEYFSGGQRISEPVQSIDLFTTILDLVNVDRETVSSDLQGHNLLPDKIRANPRSVTVTEFLAPNMRKFRKVNRAEVDLSRFERKLRSFRVRETGYKLIWSSDDHHELYDLRHDPDETHNLAEREPEQLKMLLDQMENWLTTIHPVEFDRLEVEMNEELVQRLQDLGYL